MSKILSFRFGLISFFVLIIFNVAILDIWVVKNSTSTNESSSFQLIPITSMNAVCPTSCVSEIHQVSESVKALQEKSTQTAMPSQSGSTPAQGAPTPIQLSSTVKEYFVPFGSGSNATDDWADVAGLQAYIDSTQYGLIKNVIFEASVQIPTGNEKAYVRLFNDTDKHPVWLSEVSLEGGTPALLTSSSITLDYGNKLYKVQMKTSLKYTANLMQARMHITIY